MAKVRPHNPDDPRSPKWHTDVWDFIEEHGVDRTYENAGFDVDKVDDFTRSVVKEGERIADENARQR